MQISCETCTYDYKKCSKPDELYQEDYNEESEAFFCKNRGFILWTPKTKRMKKFCKNCTMFGSKGCCRHAEPCLKNKRFYKFKNKEREE